MNELSPRARAMLGDYKVGVLPSDRRDAANWTAIAQRIAANEPPLLDDVEPRSRSRWPVVTISFATVAAAAVAAALLLSIDASRLLSRDDHAVMNAASHERDDALPGGQAERAEAPRGTQRAAPDAEPDAPVEPPDFDLVIVDDEDPEPKAARPSSRPRRSASGADTLGAEASSLARARAALRDGRPRDALGQLARHARRFPRGSLAKERRLLEIIARCEAGQRTRARRDAKRFIRDNPGSPLAARARGVCTQ